MSPLEEIKDALEKAVPGCGAEICPNESAAAQPSLRVDPAQGRAVAMWLRDHPALRLDYASNMTGIDWPERVEKTRTKTKQVVDGKETEVETTEETVAPGYLEAVYHLYSMRLKHGPLILRMRTENRTDRTALPSLTPVWRSCEFQEREAFDLYGIEFTDHPDLRRILMWEEFQDFPMRKDYVEPEDYEYEPTPHDDVLKKHQAQAAASAKEGAA